MPRHNTILGFRKDVVAKRRDWLVMVITSAPDFMIDQWIELHDEMQTAFDDRREEIVRQMKLFINAIEYVYGPQFAEVFYSHHRMRENEAPPPEDMAEAA